MKLRKLAWVVAMVLAVSGCGDSGDDDDSAAPADAAPNIEADAAGCAGAENECGGCVSLPAAVGDPCGTCDTGSYACDGADAVVCQGDQGDGALNGCGGCNELDTSTLDDPCGHCLLGAISCDGTDAITCVEPAAPTACYALPADAMAWWRAESDATDTVASYDGSLVGGSFVSGKVGSAFSLALGQSVRFGDIVDFDFSGTAFAVEGWIRFSALPPDLGVAGCPPHYPIFSNNAWGYSMTVTANGGLWFGKYINTLGGEGASSSEVMSLDTWHHVAAVHAVDEVRIYIDGKLEGSSALTTGDIYFDALDTPSIGNRRCGAGLFDYVGEVDELTVYTRALSVDEVRNICGADSFGKCVP